MKVCVVTGAGGLVGSACVEYFSPEFDLIIGIDNNLRAYFFGPDGDTRRRVEELRLQISNFENISLDIRDYADMEAVVFAAYGKAIDLIIHTAAQPSHDWAAREPITDFTVNANGTLNLLELSRRFCPEAIFIFTSTNKVYGDSLNKIEYIENETRFMPKSLTAVDEAFPIDRCLHSVFGASKVAADLMCQEYGKYFGLRTGIFRGGCLTGPKHSGVRLHGFLSYLVRCAVRNQLYTVIGYGGKQVRDNIHCHDLVRIFYEFYKRPAAGEVFNIGGGEKSNCSLLEAVAIIENRLGRKMRLEFDPCSRRGDHKWYISDLGKARRFFPGWDIQFGIEEIIEEIIVAEQQRLASGCGEPEFC